MKNPRVKNYPSQWHALAQWGLLCSVLWCWAGTSWYWKQGVPLPRSDPVFALFTHSSPSGLPLWIRNYTNTCWRWKGCRESTYQRIWKRFKDLNCGESIGSQDRDVKGTMGRWKQAGQGSFLLLAPSFLEARKQKSQYDNYNISLPWSN